MYNDFTVVACQTELKNQVKYKEWAYDIAYLEGKALEYKIKEIKEELPKLYTGVIH